MLQAGIVIGEHLEELTNGGGFVFHTKYGGTASPYGKGIFSKMCIACHE
jgi:hypothetical protein